MLVPALGVWGLLLTRDHLRAATRSRWRRALDDSNPGWGPVLGALGIVLATAWWFYQTSGFYPYYVLLLQRTLWWREFAEWDPTSFAYVFHKAISYARHGLLNLNELTRLVELSSLVFGLALGLSHLPPRWPTLWAWPIGSASWVWWTTTWCRDFTIWLTCLYWSAGQRAVATWKGTESSYRKRRSAVRPPS